MSDVHRTNLISLLAEAVNEQRDIVSSTHQAFVRVAALWLGFDELEESRFVDGSGDRGIDFWYVSDEGFEIYQVKSHDLGNLGELQLLRFNSEGVQDLQRATSFLLDERASSSLNSRLNSFRQQWEYAFARRKMDDEPSPVLVSLNLVLFGNGLTTSAQAEFETFARELHEPRYYKGIPVEVRARLIGTDEIVNSRWREINRDWRDKTGRKRDAIDLFPETTQDHSWIRGRDSAVFYCRAIDLIVAFEDFGYQIFEPNVRAHIRKSKVNSAIRASLMHRQSRAEFQFLNNGITIICKNYTSPRENRPCFRVNEPGVVNGLQTLVALHQAYHELSGSPEDQKHLEEKCYVLVRLLRENAVRDVNQVVLASNTQNPMQARNLRSNAPEQIMFEKLFAQLGWFYERKQGAWDAFSADSQRWRTLSSFRKSHFQVTSNGKRREKRVDNEILAQTWLSFIGFSNEAVHERRFIFEDEDLYRLSFLFRAPRHSTQYQFELAAAREEWIAAGPHPALMLVSYLARQFAKEVTLSTRENRDRACQRLGINPEETPKEELDVTLAGDNEYLFEQVLSGMSYVFVEFFGYILYRAFDAQVHDIGFPLLRNGSLAFLKETYDLSTVVPRVRSETTEPHDLLVVAWFAFRHTVNNLMAGPWKQSYQTARNRTRFNHSTQTRTHLYRELNELDKFMSRTQLTYVWASSIPAEKGLFQYFYDVIQNDVNNSR